MASRITYSASTESSIKYGFPTVYNGCFLTSSSYLCYGNSGGRSLNYVIRPAVEIPLSNTILGSSGTGIIGKEWILFD
ncbi:MAG: hypothetical protein HFJ54_05745 [Clostridia bacterium]|nr:hypothetical protein [Clostridia bacterium]